MSTNEQEPMIPSEAPTLLKNLIWCFKSFRKRPFLGAIVLLGIVGVAGVTFFNELKSAVAKSPSGIVETATNETRKPIAKALPLLGEAPLSPTTTAGDLPISAAQISAKTFVVILNVPTLFRDIEMTVDGKPAEVIERQISTIKVRVPVKSTATTFVLSGERLTKPRSFSLLIDHDNFEHVPFQ